MPSSSSRFSLAGVDPFLSEHDATWGDALHRLEAYSPSCLEGSFSEGRLQDRALYVRQRPEDGLCGTARGAPESALVAAHEDAGGNRLGCSPKFECTEFSTKVRVLGF